MPCIAGMVCWIVWLVPTDASPITQKTSTQEHTGRVPGNEADISISLMPSPSSDDGKRMPVWVSFCYYSINTCTVATWLLHTPMCDVVELSLQMRVPLSRGVMVKGAGSKDVRKGMVRQTRQDQAHRRNQGNSKKVEVR